MPEAKVQDEYCSQCFSIDIDLSGPVPVGTSLNLIFFLAIKKENEKEKLDIYPLSINILAPAPN